MPKDIKVSFPGGKRVDAQIKAFTIQTDQPVHQGGDGAAPAPFDLFLASLATCSGIYVLSFLHQRDIPADDLSLVMRSEVDQDSKMIKTVTFDIQLPPGFPEKYHKAVIKSVNSCAVKKHMETPPDFKVKITD
ncbi:MAG: OsmC family protein [Candidatus Aminicenantaceae bacterium]